MKKIRLYGNLSNISSTILGHLIVNSSLTSIDIHSCRVTPSMWHIINDSIYKDSYKLYEHLTLTLPIIGNWVTVRDMLNNNIRINNLILQGHELTLYNSTLFAEGLLNNNVINNMTFDKMLMYGPSNYNIIFSNIIKRNIKMEYLYFIVFYFYASVKNEIKYMLDNNWLKVLSIDDNTLIYETEFEYAQYQTDSIDTLDTVEIISHMKNNTSLSKFHMGDGLEPHFNEGEYATINNILSNNFTLTDVNIYGLDNIPYINRNNINKLRKNTSLEEQMYNNIINDGDGEPKCKDFINRHIVSKYEYNN